MLRAECSTWSADAQQWGVLLIEEPLESYGGQRSTPLTPHEARRLAAELLVAAERAETRERSERAPG